MLLSFLFLVILHAFWYPIFFFLKSVFSVTRIRFRTYGYLLSILTFALPNWLSPAIYAFALGVLVGWIEVVCPNIFSSWIRQKSWSAMWVAVTLVFSGFSPAYCSFNTKEKTSADPESNQGPKDVFLYYSPPLYQLSYRRVYMRSVWDICWVKRSLWSIHVSSQHLLSSMSCSHFFSQYCFLLFGILCFSFLKSDCFGDAISNLDIRISLKTHLHSSEWAPTSYICFLRIFVGWIEVVWPNNFSSWVR